MHCLVLYSYSNKREPFCGILISLVLYFCKSGRGKSFWLKCCVICVCVLLCCTFPPSSVFVLSTHDFPPRCQSLALLAFFSLFEEQFDQSLTMSTANLYVHSLVTAAVNISFIIFVLCKTSKAMILFVTRELLKVPFQSELRWRKKNLESVFLLNIRCLKLPMLSKFSLLPSVVEILSWTKTIYSTVVKTV